MGRPAAHVRRTSMPCAYRKVYSARMLLKSATSKKVKRRPPLHNCGCHACYIALKARAEFSVGTIIFTRAKLPDQKNFQTLTRMPNARCARSLREV